MALTPDPVFIPYVSQAEVANAADVPDLSEDMALRIHDLIAELQLARAAMAPFVVPVGLIAPFGGSVAPAGWHLCNGSAHNSAALSAMLTTGVLTPDMTSRFLVGAGASAVAPFTSTYSRGNTGGLATVTLTMAETPVKGHSHGVALHNADTNHVHSISGGTSANGSHNHNVYASNFIRHGDEPPGSTYHFLTQTIDQMLVGYDGNHTHSVGGNTNWQSDNPDYWGGPRYQHGHTVSQGDAANTTASEHENRPPYYAVTYIIKKGPGTVNGVPYST